MHRKFAGLFAIISLTFGVYSLSNTELRPKNPMREQLRAILSLMPIHGTQIETEFKNMSEKCLKDTLGPKVHSLTVEMYSEFWTYVFSLDSFKNGHGFDELEFDKNVGFMKSTVMEKYRQKFALTSASDRVELKNNMEAFKLNRETILYCVIDSSYHELAKSGSINLPKLK